MQKQVVLKLKPFEANNAQLIKESIAEQLSISDNAITGFYKQKQSIDARSSKQIWFNLSLLVFIDEPFVERVIETRVFKSVANTQKKAIIVGAGPAGLFAALKLIELGIKPIILERGKDVRSRRRDLAVLNKEGIIHPDSNYCFGEGGAGTYSDGKLYTRSNKRGNINSILNLFVQFGAEEQILYDAHPHIGTNKLPNIITAMREAITEYGGLFLFEEKVTDLLVVDNEITGVSTSKLNSYYADAVILATGHSARDIFELLYAKKILIEAKPFALGVRVEHPQALIDSIQYKCSHGTARADYLPPSSYSLVEQVNGRGVFSFCMCPGGIIAPAATSDGELVVNGWSPSKRNNPYANSGMVVSVELKDVQNYLLKNKNDINQAPVDSPLQLLAFQKMVEQNCFQLGGGKFVAPAQRLVDFCEGRVSTDLPKCSYQPGVAAVELKQALPNFVASTLQLGFKEFGKKMKGYYTNEAIVVATESRTSSPVRIPRNAETLEHPQISNLYPCGEGAGYAGGIVSAAMDGERVAVSIAMKLGLNV